MELFATKRIFVPMPRVHTIDPMQIVISGVVDTRRFDRRDQETLIIADVFDRKVRRAGSDQDSIVYDVAIAPVRSWDWEITEVALREAGPKKRFGIGNSGQTVIVDWSEVPMFAVQSEHSTEGTVAKLRDMRPADVAQELHDMAPERLTRVIAALDDEQLADAIGELPEDEQVTVISKLDTERAADILEEMDPDDAADLVKDLPTEMAEGLLELMEPDEAEDVRALLAYDEYSAGGMMTPEPVMLGADDTVARALARVRRAEVTPALASMVFITRPPLDTPSGRYLGVVHTQRLLRHPPTVQLGSLIDPNMEPLHPSSTLAEVSRFFAAYNLVVAPVVDSERRLVGAVTVDDVVDHMLPLDWRGKHMDGPTGSTQPSRVVTK